MRQASSRARERSRGTTLLKSEPLKARQTNWDRIWKGVWSLLNSTITVAIVGGVLAAALTHWYSRLEASAADLASRRNELRKIVVELDYRLMRLKLVGEQWDARAQLPKDVLTRAGERAIAIISGDNDTSTTAAEFKGSSVISLLSSAESDAGVPWTDKDFVLTYSDLINCAAATQANYVYMRLSPELEYLKQELAGGRLPIALNDRASGDYEAALYSKVLSLSTQNAAKFDALGAPQGGNPAATYLKTCQAQEAKGG
jgi:hypothetical protein